ncbi:uncharacterized protein LOC141907876 [Tubulanus polymorphus]|uniref:uncharacterized protein LOC141907876 n=1 Tax=Tubulanus polymorphus TaxID=672921 RepID=UPI003DA52EAF
MGSSVATANGYKHEISVSYNGRKVNVWSEDSQNQEVGAIRKYFYDPLFDFNCGLLVTHGDLLEMVLTLWTDELETMIVKKLKEYCGETIRFTVQMIPIDEVNLDWREIPPGITVPYKPMAISHSPMKQRFVVKCKDQDMASEYKANPYPFMWGLHVMCTRQKIYQSFKVNLPIRDTESHTELQRLHVELPSLKRELNDTKIRCDDLEDRTKRAIGIENAFNQLTLDVKKNSMRVEKLEEKVRVLASQRQYQPAHPSGGNVPKRRQKNREQRDKKPSGNYESGY